MDYFEKSVKQWATDWTVRVRFTAQARYFSPLQSVQTGSGACLASYLMGTGVSFHQG
jgi:hypothetical protein